ncbi:hypothetical protein GT030_30240 [Streptomyces sp. SID1328]|uniref:hypothetical protein n=1 Tax=Streptomyces sp. SID1328 TaxID=2690250 RepID=UPI00136FF62C|nr:hypothetical protein [Streptomyces sp. SID1328]MYV43025.1 hypothetical protein [Streptomyces sp. SID1328]
MKTTGGAEEVRRAREHNRARAWTLMTAHLPDTRKVPRYSPDRPGALKDIAPAYDRICRQAAGVGDFNATDTEVLAALLAIRMLREKLDHDEHRLASLARSRRITWARIAEWQELSGRQAAERRHLQLGQPSQTEDGRAHATQSERVENVRARRVRLAERQWAMKNAGRIRRAAAQLASVEDLQQRVENSHEARVLRAPTNHTKYPAKEPRTPLVWPSSLREAVAEAERLRTQPPPHTGDSLHSPEDQRQQQEADTAHRLLGLIAYAANPRNIDLSDLPDLADAIRDICNDSQEAGNGRRRPGMQRHHG